MLILGLQMILIAIAAVIVIVLIGAVLELLQALIKLFTR